MDLENYLEHLKTLDEKYQWPVERYEERFPERQEVHKEFSFVVTYPGLYGCGCILDEMADWCRQHYGDRDGKCHWKKCELSIDQWYEKSGLDDELDRQLDEADEDDKNKIIDEHFEMIDEREDVPKEHNHTGTWTTFFVVKTGYDYGYEDFCFKNREAALHFKLIWDSEVERRK